MLLILHLAAGNTPRAGVSPGSWANYVASQHVTGNATLVKSVGDSFSTYANVSFVSLNITQVLADTNVSLVLGIHRTNGKSNSSALVVDVALPWSQDDPPIIISQNYPSLGSSTGVFFGVARTIHSLSVGPNTFGNLTSASRYTWDNETGLLLSKLLTYTIIEPGNETNSGTFTYTSAMSGTNLWHASPGSSNSGYTDSGLLFTELYALTGVIGSIALGIAGYTARKRSKARLRSGRER